MPQTFYYSFITPRVYTEKPLMRLVHMGVLSVKICENSHNCTIDNVSILAQEFIHNDLSYYYYVLAYMYLIFHCCHKSLERARTIV